MLLLLSSGTHSNNGDILEDKIALCDRIIKTKTMNNKGEIKVTSPNQTIMINTALANSLCIGAQLINQHKFGSYGNVYNQRDMIVEANTEPAFKNAIKKLTKYSVEEFNYIRSQLKKEQNKTNEGLKHNTLTRRFSIRKPPIDMSLKKSSEENIKDSKLKHRFSFRTKKQPSKESNDVLEAQNREDLKNRVNSSKEAGGVNYLQAIFILFEVEWLFYGGYS